MVNSRKAIETLYNDTCTITEYKDYTKPNKSTGKRETVVLENQPCKLSYATIQPTMQSGTVGAVIQKLKLFIASEVEVNPGSKITVLKDGRTLEFGSSGEPALHPSHQEIMLELFKGWS